MDSQKKSIFRLKNGIQVMIIPLPTSLTNVSIGILLGRNHESPDELQLTHYMEHLMAHFTSNKYNSHKIISNELTRRGATIEAYVSDYETKFSIVGLYKDVSFFLDIMSNTLSNFYIDTSIVNQEKNAVIQELQQKMAVYYYNFNVKIWKYMHPNQGFRYDYLRGISNLQNYQYTNMYDFIKTHIILKNVLISITCPLHSVSKTKKLIKQYFTNISPVKFQKKQIQYPVTLTANKSVRVIYINNKPYSYDNSTIRIVISDNIKFMSQRHLCMIIINHILFDINGEFYNVLRRKLGLIYNIGMILDIDLLHSQSSSYYIETNCDYSNIHVVMKALLDVIETVQITDIQMKNAKINIDIGYEYSKFFNLTSHSTYYEKFLLYNKSIIEKSQAQRMISNISKADVLNSLREFKANVLQKGLLFYYAKKNRNGDIKKLLSAKSCEYLVL